jgi:hypothetical protein
MILEKTDIQTAEAHRLVADPELAEAFEFAMSKPTPRTVFKALGFKMTPEEFLAQKECFTFVTFEPAEEKTPPPLQANLVWVWAVLLQICLLRVWILRVCMQIHGTGLDTCACAASAGVRALRWSSRLHFAVPRPAMPYSTSI